LATQSGQSGLYPILYDELNACEHVFQLELSSWEASILSIMSTQKSKVDEETSLVATVTTETVPGYEITEVLGIARGNTVRARNVGRDITQGFRNLAGGELKAYSRLLSDARDEAIFRMETNAADMGGDAVVNVRMETSEITKGASEVIAYGTAVRLE
jgi:uncharacterized protein YbjQ (UPF0145 family)